MRSPSCLRGETGVNARRSPSACRMGDGRSVASRLQGRQLAWDTVGYAAPEREVGVGVVGGQLGAAQPAHMRFAARAPAFGSKAARSRPSTTLNCCPMPGLRPGLQGGC